MTDLVRIVCGSCPPSRPRVMGRIISTPDGPRLVARLRRTDLPAGAGITVSARRDDVDELVADLGNPYNGTSMIVLGCKAHGWGAAPPDAVRAWLAEAETAKKRPRVIVLDVGPD